MGKVIAGEASRRGFDGREVALDAKPGLNPSKPLANVKHERFCGAIVQGHRLGPAYETAGFTGKSPRLPWQLRHKPRVDARVTWLLAQRIEADMRERHRLRSAIGKVSLMASRCRSSQRPEGKGAAPQAREHPLVVLPMALSAYAHRHARGLASTRDAIAERHSRPRKLSPGALLRQQSLGASCPGLARTA